MDQLLTSLDSIAPGLGLVVFGGVLSLAYLRRDLP